LSHLLRISHQSFRCKTHVSQFIINQMKVFFKFVFGFTILPLTIIALFVLFNWILSLLFNVNFQELNHSGIWMAEGLLTIVFVVMYLTYALDEE
jgi:uncharacterized membrane protein HdeD (DUF308 family)